MVRFVGIRGQNRFDTAAPRIQYSADREYHPRQHAYQKNRDVIPKGLLVLIEIGAESLEVVLNEEDVEELRRPKLRHDKPRQSNHKINQEARQPDRAQEG